MRNIFYLLYLVLPFIILFIVVQLKYFLENYRSPTLQALLVIGAHILFAGYLLSLGDIILTSYITIALSMTFFLLMIFGKTKHEHTLFLIMLFVLTIFQPVEVFKHYRNNISNMEINRIHYVKQKPIFSYQRPRFSKNIPFAPEIIPENSGFHLKKYAGVKWSNFILQNMNHKAIEEYIRHKFVIYDQTQAPDSLEIDFKRIQQSMQRDENIAYVFSPDATSRTSTYIAPNAQKIKQDTSEFKVTDFNLNSITFVTNFNRDRFIVYNDSFYKGWRAWVNGEQTDIIRSNIAFKGLWLPAGENVVVMRFKSIWLNRYYFFLLIFFLGFFIYFIKSCIKPNDALRP